MTSKYKVRVQIQGFSEPFPALAKLDDPLNLTSPQENISGTFLSEFLYDQFCLSCTDPMKIFFANGLTYLRQPRAARKDHTYEHFVAQLVRSE